MEDNKNDKNANSKKENDVFEKCYERAIKAREHHYNNFNYWTNFYAIIIGALFVGYYEVSSNEFLQIVVSIVGFAASFAWLQSFRGYYHWIKHWIEVVMFHETQYLKSVTDCKNMPLSEEDRNKLRVYSLYYEHGSPCCPFNTKNISTQKISLRFIWLLVLAWGILLLNNFFQLLCNYCTLDFLNNCSECSCILLSIGIAAALLIIVFIMIIFCLPNESDIDKHHRLKKDIKGYQVESPIS